MASNPRNSMPPGQGVANGFHTNGVAAMPHIEDVIALPKDIDRNQPVKRLLEIAEASLRQAEFSRDIKRLGPALQDFLKASIITVQYIGQHRDYEFVKSRPELAARHATLLKKIKQQNDDFARIKEQIIADNKRTGVLPTSSRPGSSHTTNGPRPSSSSSDRPSPSFTSSHSRNGSAVNGSAIKSKPTVQPKPASLHGNSLKMGHARANSLASTTSGSSTQDLAARFANLRGPQASPGQDPRIKTHHINLPEKPAGPRAMPSPTKPQLSIVSSVPSLPKLPDAIYSPARGSVSGEAGRLPSSTNRGLFSRTASTVSATSSPNLSRQQSHASDYFAGAQTPTNGSSLSRASSRDTSLDMPRGDSLTPEALVHVMKTKVSILLIDVRSREEFNEGHIMHSTIICIEPGILERESISADEISQSMVLAPNQEQAHFERRNTFDLVVFYDESSSEVPTRYDTNEELVIMSLHRALVQFNYGKELKHPPKILKGGLEAWVDLMGSGSLQSTADPSSRSQPSHRNRNVTIERRRSRYVVKQLKPDDIKQWEETIQKDDQDVAASPNFVRTREDFLRRFPSVSMGQQSMTAPVEPRPRYGSSHKNDLESELPSPPSRPAPALPRQSYSGFAQGPDDQEAHDGTIAQKLSGPAGKSTTQVVPAEAPKFYTGLTNPHNWCYANGLLQSLLASPEFGREMADSEWVKRHVVPRKPDEKMDHPQLMTRIVSNLFHWMSSGKFQVMKAQTLMDYVRHLCKQSSSAIQFGGSNQQDAQEFMGFLLDVIHDETNVHRNLKGKETQPPEPSKTGLSVLQTAARFWQSHLQFNQSIIDRYWRLLEVTEVRCRECATRTFTFSSWFCLMLPVTEATTLEAAIKKKCQPELIQGFHCNHCRRATNSDRSEYYARMPPLVCVVLNRFNALTSSSKCVDRVSWDFNNLDLSPYFLNPADCTTSSSDVSLANDPAFTGPFHYECYAVLIHVGGSVNSGHYYAYVRDQGTHDPYAWYCCNDERVTKVRIGCGGAGDERERVFKTGADAVPYMAFFRRKQGR